MFLPVTHLPRLSVTVVRSLSWSWVKVIHLLIYLRFSKWFIWSCSFFHNTHFSILDILHICVIAYLWLQFTFLFKQLLPISFATHMHESHLIWIEVDGNHEIEIILLCIRDSYTWRSQVSNSVLPISVSCY